MIHWENIARASGAGEGGTEGKMLVNMESGVRWPKSVWDGTTTGAGGRADGVVLKRMERDHNTI